MVSAPPGPCCLNWEPEGAVRLPEGTSGGMPLARPVRQRAKIAQTGSSIFRSHLGAGPFRLVSIGWVNRGERS